MLENISFINVRESLLYSKDPYAVAVFEAFLHSLIAALRSFSVRDGHICLSGRSSFTFLMYFNRAITKNRRKMTRSTFVRVLHMASHAMGHVAYCVIGGAKKN